MNHMIFNKREAQKQVQTIWFYDRKIFRALRDGAVARSFRKLIYTFRVDFFFHRKLQWLLNSENAHSLNRSFEVK